MSGTHAPVAPSALPMIAACAAYLRMATPYANDPSTEEQLEGDAAHWVALQYAQGFNVPVGGHAPNGITVTDEMIRGGILWRDHVGPNSICEMPVQITAIHDMDCYGTPDNWSWDPVRGLIRAPDYKFGHSYVDAERNYQLIAYAAGIADLIGIDGHDAQNTYVEMGIVQPRYYHAEPIRTWTVPLAELRAEIQWLRMRVEEAQRPDAAATTGAHCKLCPARHECTALQRVTGSLVDFSGSVERANLPNDVIGNELTLVADSIQRLEARHTGLEAQIESRIRAGQFVQGYKIESKAGNLAWTIPATEVAALDARLLKDPQQPQILTPTQGIAAGVDGTVIGKYAKRPPGTMKLVRAKPVKQFGSK